MATTTYTTNLRLKVSSDLTADAKYNLGVLDTIGAKLTIGINGDTKLRSSTDIVIEPECPEVAGGHGDSTGNVSIGTASNLVDNLDLYATRIDMHGAQLNNMGLDEYNIYIGDSSNQSQEVNTLIVGDISASIVTGLQIKAGAVGDLEISDVDMTKVTGLQAALDLKADITYVDSSDAILSAATSLVQSNLTAHEVRQDNPHIVTAFQVGAYSKTEMDDLLTGLNAGQIIVSSSDTTIGYLSNKLTVGDGISSTIIYAGGDESLQLDNTDRGSVAVTAHELAYSHGDIAHTNRVALDAVSGTNTGDEDQTSIKTKLGAASAIADGYLTSANWSTFNSKLSADVVDTDTTLAANSDSLVPSQKAIKAYTDLRVSPNQIVTVAKAGGDFTDVKAAVDSISDANSSTKPYSILVFPGVYTVSTPIVLKDGVFLKGTDISSCILAGTGNIITGSLGAGEKSGIDGLTINCSPNSAADVVAVDLAGDYVLTNFVINVVTGASFNGSLEGLKINSGNLMYLGLFGVNLVAYAGTVVDYCGVTMLGTNTTSAYQSASNIFSDRATGTYTGICVSGSGLTAARELIVYINIANPAFSGTAIGFSCSTASVSDTFVRIAKGCGVTLIGAGSGTAYATKLDSGGSSANFRYDELSVHMTGFTTEQIDYTGSTDSQRLWITSLNKNISNGATGLSISTPQDQNATGFIRWGGAGDYYSINTGTGLFTVLRAGAGAVKSTPVTWAAGQSLTLTSLATNYVYMTSTGIIAATVTSTSTLYDSNIVLFEVWWDGTTYAIITKENHAYEYITAVSKWAHKTFGPLVTGLGATITQLGADSARQLSIVGDDTILDHGLESTITSAPAVAATFRIVYTNASGKMQQDGAALTTFLSRYSNAGTPTNAANNDRIVIRIGVLKDDLNSSTPIYVGCLHNAVDGNNSAALNAISAGNIIAFPAEMKALEVVQLGFLVIQANGAGAGSIISGGVVVAKQAFGASLIGASSAAQASLITTSTTNFVASGGVSSVLSGADATVQAALDTVARGVSSRYSTALVWAGSAGAYTMSILGATHSRGITPIIQLYYDTGSTYQLVIGPDVDVSRSTGDITISSNENFAGDIIVL